MSTETFYDMIQDHNQTGGNGTLSCNTDTVEFGQWLKISVSISCSLSIFGALLVILKVATKPPYNGLQQRQPPPEVALNATGQYGAIVEPHTNVQVESGNLSDVGNGNAGTQNNSNRCKLFCSDPRVVSRPAVIILISISVADILVAVSHLWGVLSSYVEGSYNNKTRTRYDYAECGAQAFVAVFGTISSLLWSDVLVFIGVVVYWCSSKNIKRFTSVYAFVVYSVIGWVVPFLVVMILGGGLDAFGFAEGIGWCYMNLKNGHQKEDLLIGWLSYDLWANVSILFICCSAIYLLFIVCADLSKAFEQDPDNPRTRGGPSQNLLHNPQQNHQDKVNRRRRKQLACKMVTAALFVVLLRMWSLIINVYLFKPLGSRERNELLCDKVLQILSGIGTSSQGTVNAILFVITPGLVTLCRLCKNKCRSAN